MGKFPSAPLIAAAFLMTFTTAPVWASNVKITPLGTKDGEFCGPDRALLFEDLADGTTILWDPGRTVRGAADARLPQPVEGVGGLDGILLSSVHQDHLGEKFFIDNGNCSGSSNPASNFVSTTPDSNTAQILAGHPNAFMPAAGELRGFMRAKLTQILTAEGILSSSEIKDQVEDQVNTLRPGGVRTIGGVTVAVIPAFHSNGIGTKFLTGNNQLTNPAGKKTNGVTQHVLSEELAPDGLTAYVGPDNGFVLTFSNGLVVYLTADTGQFGDMKTIVKDYYSDFLQLANGLLVVVNMGGIFSMGPEEAAWAVATLLDADAVIPSHANQVSTTSGAVTGSKVGDFIDALDGTAPLNKAIPVHVPLSGLAMEFTSNGLCVSGPPPC